MISPPLPKSAMKLWIIQWYPYLSRARSGIFLDILFGSQQLRAKILSNSGQEAKPVETALTSSNGLKEKNIHTVCFEDNYFPKGYFKLFNSLFHSDVYLVFSIRLFSIANLFVRYLWDVRNEDKCCVVTHRAVGIRVAWLVYLVCLR